MPQGRQKLFWRGGGESVDVFHRQHSTSTHPKTGHLTLSRNVWPFIRLWKIYGAIRPPPPVLPSSDNHVPPPSHTNNKRYYRMNHSLLNWHYLDRKGKNNPRQRGLLVTRLCRSVSLAWSLGVSTVVYNFEGVWGGPWRRETDVFGVLRDSEPHGLSGVAPSVVPGYHLQQRRVIKVISHNHRENMSP